ncbi:MAG: glycosyltransferase family 39 protein [Chloroflexi bacterium]|nr:glycosyltransferase family 39 protein [Chloroflexota bacterium]
MTSKLATTTARPALSWPRAVPAAADILASLGLFALAAAVRFQGLLTVPRFTDEQLDTLYTLPLFRHQGLPIVGFDPYNGPLYSYLLATSLWLLGPQPATQRVLVALLGCGAVLLTYWLGRGLSGRIGGLVGAGLLATCAAHVVVNSHVGWSNATTPFFTTLAFVVILPAVTRGSGPRMALGAGAFGLALQSHPSVVAFLPGVALAILIKRPRLVLSRWTVLGALLFLVGYSPVIAYNLLPSGRDSYRELTSSLLANWGQPEDLVTRLGHEQEINADGQSGKSAYLTNFSSLALNLPRTAASLIEPWSVWTDYLHSPAFWLYGAVVLLGLAWPSRRGNPLPLLAGLSFLFLLALMNGKYEPIFNGRYLMPVLPLAFAGFGALAQELWTRWRARAPRLALALVAALLVLQPLWLLNQYLGRNWADGQINQDLMDAAAALPASRRPDEPIVLDDALGRRNLVADGDLLMNLRVFLEFQNVPYRVGPVTPGKLADVLGGARSAVVVVAQPYNRALEDRFRFVPLSDRTSGRFAVYRVQVR